MAKRKAPAKAPEGYTVLARRYRPQSFDDLVGQEPVAQGLINALQSGRVAHAYLFTGARGVGKTSTARILAKCLNCEKGPTGSPCNQCDQCQAIAAGDDIDVLEIDGASNTGIEDVRELRGNVQFRPSRSRYKIYIIDEVHMLSKAAFNGLLKTLEEPPPHVKFIFATTEVEKIPITILSRCQRFDFAGIGSPRIVQRLKDIAAAEGTSVEDEALEILARRAAGSMRDAQSLLDQLMAFGGEQLTVDQVHRLLGTADDDRVAELAAAALESVPTRALKLLDQAVDEGTQLGELVDQLIAYWRDLMVVHATGLEAPNLSVGSKHRPALAEHAKRRTLDTLLAGLDILSSTRGRLRTSNHGRVLVEMALVRLGRLDDLVSLTQLAQAVATGQGATMDSRPVPAKPALPLSNAQQQGQMTGAKAAPTRQSPTPGLPASSRPKELTTESLPSIWAQVLAQQGPFLSKDLEKAGFPAISGPNHLVLRFPREYNASRDRCQDSETVGRIELLLQQITGQKCRLQIETSSSGLPNAGLSARLADDTEPSPTRLPPPRDEAADPPLVKWTKDFLGAKPVKADPGFGASSSAGEQRAGSAGAEEQ